MAQASPPYQIGHAKMTTVYDGTGVITPSDTVDCVDALDPCPTGYWIGSSGNVSVMWASGRVTPFTAHPGGWLAARCRRIMATGTTATNIVAVF